MTMIEFQACFSFIIYVGSCTLVERVKEGEIKFRSGRMDYWIISSRQSDLIVL